MLSNFFPAVDEKIPEKKNTIHPGGERYLNKLLLLSNRIAALRTRECLYTFIDTHFKEAFHFHDLLILLVDDQKDPAEQVTLFPSRSSKKNSSGYDQATDRFPIRDGFTDLLFNTRSPLILPFRELLKQKKIPAYLGPWTRRQQINSLVAVPIIVNNKPGGLLIFSHENKKTLADGYLTALTIVCNQLLGSLSTILTTEKMEHSETQKNVLLSLSNELAVVGNKIDLHRIVSEKLTTILPVHAVSIWTISRDGQWYAPIVPEPGGGRLPAADEIIDLVFASGQPMIVGLEELIKRPATPPCLKNKAGEGLKGVIFSPFKSGNEKPGFLLLFTRTRTQLEITDASLIRAISSQVSSALTILAVQEKIRTDSENSQKLPTENNPFPELIGDSTAMKSTCRLITQVAPTPTAVLITGETGTGKELVARAIHTASPRKRRTMIRVNCGSIQPNLIESELFGHEKGSFTGATERRIGKFELANNSTLFLDEVGELPMELQVKLLRALQEKEIERLGGNTIIKVDVRIIAATNRDLLKDVHEGKFRKDLYFRLNVFPIFVPPLRERKEDLPGLAAHFLLKYAKNDPQKITGLSSNAIKQLTAYDWPGNVRELEHQIERNCLLTGDTIIKHLDLPSGRNGGGDTLLPQNIATIDEIEREHIIRVLKICKGRISGVGGAAGKLKIPATTLYSKLKRLKIKKDYKN